MRRNIKWGNVAILFIVWGAFSTLQILQVNIVTSIFLVIEFSALENRSVFAYM